VGWGIRRPRSAHAAIGAARHSEDEALYDRLGERHDAAIKRPLRTPAPMGVGSRWSWSCCSRSRRGRWRAASSALLPFWGTRSGWPGA